MEFLASYAVDGQNNLQFYLHLAEGFEAEILQHLKFTFILLVLFYYITLNTLGKVTLAGSLNQPSSAGTLTVRETFDSTPLHSK
jgi:hypothetical protein